MGYMSLLEFREELNMALGDFAQSSNKPLDRWINRAYIEVVSKIEYDGLLVEETFSSILGQADYTFPAAGDTPLTERILGIKVLVDLTNKRRLLHVPTRNFMLYDPETQEIPKIYSRRGQIISLWPTPDAAANYKFIAILEPAKLSVGADITVIPAAWDHAILLLAERNGWQTLRRRDEAVLAHQSAMTYINQTLEDTEYEDGTPSIGLEVASSFEDMTDMRSSF